MAALSDSEIRTMCKVNPALITDFLDFEEQLQPAGFDLSLAKIFLLQGRGKIRSFHCTNSLPDKVELDVKDGTFQLNPGYYLALFNEIITLPNDIAGIGKPRSTLIRYGVHVNAGIWDPGFCGKSQCGISVLTPHGIEIERTSTLLQVLFVRLGSSSSGFDYNYLYKDPSGGFKEL